ncbi:heterokaryon incompatibility protein [Colletotrichum sojae]|uniref:Heterokaryon incompatibility protein n=1 Tax=Colletotrichum sojae TaxID=2175907 RepID=A0A8H6J7P1_9PEZI|nr:heterokaryon incompatibility protein [Colletotrichum sojae]
MYDTPSLHDGVKTNILLMRLFNHMHLVERAPNLNELANPPEKLANPVYEIPNYLQYRFSKEPPVHDEIICNSAKCHDAETEPTEIHGLRYHCLDCNPELDFCSSCVEPPGQGIAHEPTHRLLQLPATECSLCLGVNRLKITSVFDGVKEFEFGIGSIAKGSYREYSASGAALRRVSETKSCGFCAMVSPADAESSHLIGREGHAVCSCQSLAKFWIRARLVISPRMVAELPGKTSGLSRFAQFPSSDPAALSPSLGLFTRQSNHEAYRQDGIVIDDLPKTIRDAIHATRWLGLKYLWVDRLCIIQDSADDWVHEAALMCDVYSSAAITLSADGSSSAEEEGGDMGLLLHKPQHHQTQSGRTSEMSQLIDSRGWTMQERLMSRRVLHFTSDELVWECNTLTEFECRRESGPSNKAVSASGARSMVSIYESWQSVVLDYTKRSLAYESDKMPPLRGLVERFQLLMDQAPGRHLSQRDEYLAGLWRGDLVAELAWKPPSEDDIAAFRKATNRPKMDDMPSIETFDWMRIIHERNDRENWHQSEGYVAPSWSWAHLRGPISYLLCAPPTPFVSYVEIIEAKTIPKNPKEPTGQLSSGFITMEGHMARGLSILAVQGIFTDNKIWDLCFLTYKAGHSFSIQFMPDDWTATRRHDGSVTNAAIMFLGTKHFKLPKGDGIAGLGGLVQPIQMSKSARADGGDVSAQLANLDLSASTPEEMRKVFAEEYGFGRCASYLVLVESQKVKDKYERIGCFDIASDRDTEIMRALFCYSVEDRITII